MDTPRLPNRSTRSPQVEVITPSGRSLRPMPSPYRITTAPRQGQTGSIQAKSTNGRLMVVSILFTLSSIALLVKIYDLQFNQTAFLSRKARAQQQLQLGPFTPRRMIVDRAGDVLAIDRPIYTLYAHPTLFKESADEIAAKLAPLLSRTTEDLTQLFSTQPSGIKVEFSLPEEIRDRIVRLQLDGLELLQQQERFYPQKDLFAEVIGYVNTENRGQTGIELSQEDTLQYAEPKMLLNQTGLGQVMPDRIPIGFFQRDDRRLQLTLDSRLQRTTRLVLQQQLQKYGAKRGAVIVMDSLDGSLLALVSDPSFDPNQYYKAASRSMELLKNWAVTDLYEPGSTFKPINVAIALEAGVIKPNDSFYDEGQITVGGWPIENFDFSSAGAHGPLSITEILQYSSNVGMTHIMFRLKPDQYYTWLSRLGIGQPIGVDLPFANSGYLKPRQEFVAQPIEPATAAFGQGLSVTPLQLAQLHATLANGGKLVTPHVVKGLTNTQGQLTGSQPKRPPAQKVFSPQTAQSVLNMMETVVVQGTGKPAKIAGYRVGGKTGTAQKANPNGGGYLSNAKITSFVGIMPIDRARYVVAAIIDEPRGDNAFGSTVAAPIVKAVMENLITIEGIPPSSSTQSQP